MPRVPNEIRDCISNAEYYLEAADRLPDKKENAAHIFLVILAWENLGRARKKLSNWAQKNNKKLPNDHAVNLEDPEKFKGSGCYISHIVIKPGVPALQKDYCTGEELKKLRIICQFGDTGASKNIRKIFASGWHVDRFREFLRRQIDWEKLWLEYYENL